MKKFIVVIILIIILIPLICVVDCQINPWGNGEILVLMRNGLSKSGGKLYIYEKGEMIIEDFSKISPYKISSGIFRSKYKAVAIGVHTASPFHPKPHEKIFIYVLYKNKLKPFFRSSKTSAVLDDFNLYDENNSGESNIITIEDAHNEKFIYRYKNNGFGFDVEDSIKIKRAEFISKDKINITTDDWEKIISLDKLNSLFIKGEKYYENKK